MIKVIIRKISTSQASITWLTVFVAGEFPYMAMIQSSKSADSYVLDQEISVPQGALRPMPNRDVKVNDQVPA